MSASLTTNLTITLLAKYLNTLSDGNIVTDPGQLAYADALANGTGLEQCNLSYHGTRTLAASTAETLDLAGGLTDAFGNALTFARIKLLWIVNANQTAGYNLTVGAAASNPWEAWTSVAGSTFLVGPNGVGFLYSPSAAGFVVNASTAHNLKINNGNAASVTYSIFILGANA